jgi:hypothetical protein
MVPCGLPSLRPPLPPSRRSAAALCDAALPLPPLADSTGNGDDDGDDGAERDSS